MNSVEARKQHEACQHELQALEAQRDALGLELGDLHNRRNAAVRSLARGDGSQRKIILSLEAQMVPKAQVLEGLGALVAEAVAKVAEASANLEAIQAQEDAAAQAAAREAERQECERIRAGVPAHERKIFELYVALCQELGLYMLNQERIVAPAMTDFGVALRSRLAAMAKADGLKLFNLAGPLANLQIWAAVKPNGYAHQGDVVDFKQYAAWTKEQVLLGYLKEQNAHE